MTRGQHGTNIDVRIESDWCGSGRRALDWHPGAGGVGAGPGDCAGSGRSAGVTRAPPATGVPLGRESRAFLYERPGGDQTTFVSFWRIHWSPVGPGHVCYVTTGNEGTPGALRIALHDNAKLLDYLTHQVLGTYNRSYIDGPSRGRRGHVRRSGDKRHRASRELPIGQLHRRRGVARPAARRPDRHPGGQSSDQSVRHHLPAAACRSNRDHDQWRGRAGRVGSRRVVSRLRRNLNQVTARRRVTPSALFERRDLDLDLHRGSARPRRSSSRPGARRRSSAAAPASSAESRRRSAAHRPRARRRPSSPPPCERGLDVLQALLRLVLEVVRDGHRGRSRNPSCPRRTPTGPGARHGCSRSRLRGRPGKTDQLAWHGTSAPQRDTPVTAAATAGPTCRLRSRGTRRCGRRPRRVAAT